MKRRTERRRIIRPGVAGVKISGHVGRWSVYGLPIPVRTADGTTDFLYTVSHDTMSKAPSMVLDPAGNVIIPKLPSFGLADELAKKGFELL